MTLSYDTHRSVIPADSEIELRICEAQIGRLTRRMWLAADRIHQTRIKRAAAKRHQRNSLKRVITRQKAIVREFELEIGKQHAILARLRMGVPAR